MTCKHCGAPLIEGEKFCRNCGNAIPVIEKVEAETVSEPEPVKTMDDYDYPESDYSQTAKAESTESSSSYSGYENTNNNYNNGYAQPQSGAGTVLSIISMILGIVSVVCCCCGGLNGMLGAAAIVCGIIALVKGSGNRGMAIAGIITGALGALMGLGIFIGSTSDMMKYMPELPGGNSIEDFGDFGGFEDIIENFEF